MHVLCQETNHTPSSYRPNILSPPSKASSLMLSERGIAVVDWILDILCRTAYIKKLIDYDCELWIVRKVGVVELLWKEIGVSPGPFIDYVDRLDQKWTFQDNQAKCKPCNDRPTLFLLYTGQYSLFKFLKILEKVRGHYIWMDVFYVDHSLHGQVETNPCKNQSLGKRSSRLYIGSLNDMVIVLNKPGRIEDAGMAFKAILQDRKLVQGPDHLDTLSPTNNLAYRLTGQGRFDEAELLLEEVLIIRRRVLGDDHPNTLMSISNMASVQSALARC